MGKTDQLTHELKQMEGEMKKTSEVNYEKYNDTFMDKLAEHTRETRREKSENADSQIQDRVLDGAIYLHNKAKGRIIYY